MIVSITGHITAVNTRPVTSAATYNRNSVVVIAVGVSSIDTMNIEFCANDYYQGNDR